MKFKIKTPVGAPVPGAAQAGNAAPPSAAVPRPYPPPGSSNSTQLHAPPANGGGILAPFSGGAPGAPGTALPGGLPVKKTFKIKRPREEDDGGGPVGPVFKRPAQDVGGQRPGGTAPFAYPAPHAPAAPAQAPAVAAPKFKFKKPGSAVPLGGSAQPGQPSHRPQIAGHHAPHQTRPNAPGSHYHGSAPGHSHAHHGSVHGAKPPAIRFQASSLLDAAAHKEKQKAAAKAQAMDSRYDQQLQATLYDKAFGMGSAQKAATGAGPNKLKFKVKNISAGPPPPAGLAPPVPAGLTHPAPAPLPAPSYNSGLPSNYLPPNLAPVSKAPKIKIKLSALNSASAAGSGHPPPFLPPGGYGMPPYQSSVLSAAEAAAMGAAPYSNLSMGVAEPKPRRKPPGPAQVAARILAEPPRPKPVPKPRPVPIPAPAPAARVKRSRIQVSDDDENDDDLDDEDFRPTKGPRATARRESAAAAAASAAAAAGDGTPGSAGRRPPKERAPPSAAQHARAQAARASLHALMKKVLDGVVNKDNKQGDQFLNPVTDADAPGYSAMIKEPMCFTVMQSKLEAGAYNSWDAFEYDMNLVWSNAQRYNPADSYIVHHSKYLSDVARLYITQARKGNTNFRGVAAGITRKYWTEWNKKHPEFRQAKEARPATGSGVLGGGSGASLDEAKLRMGGGVAAAAKERHSAAAAAATGPQYGRGYRNREGGVVVEPLQLTDRQHRNSRGPRAKKGKAGEMRPLDALDDRKIAATYMRRNDADDMRGTYPTSLAGSGVPLSEWRGLAGGVTADGAELCQGNLTLRSCWPGGTYPDYARANVAERGPGGAVFPAGALPQHAYAKSVARFVRRCHPLLQHAVVQARLAPCMPVEGGVDPQPPAKAPGATPATQPLAALASSAPAAATLSPQQAAILAALPRPVQDKYAQISRDQGAQAAITFLTHLCTALSRPQAAGARGAAPAPGAGAPPAQPANAPGGQGDSNGSQQTTGGAGVRAVGRGSVEPSGSEEADEPPPDLPAATP